MLLSLPASLQNLWTVYRRLESYVHSPRPETLAALDAFIDALLESPEDIWRSWALSMAAEFVDRGGYQVRGSLFERVIFPALKVGIDRHEPNCARWLGSMAQHLYRCHRCVDQLGSHRASAYVLFRLALSDDPTDARSRR